MSRNYRYVGAQKWESGKKYDTQSKYDIKLRGVKCTRGEWGSCTFSEYTRYCKHSQDVFLSCQGKLLCGEKL